MGVCMAGNSLDWTEMKLSVANGLSIASNMITEVEPCVQVTYTIFDFVQGFVLLGLL